MAEIKDSLDMVTDATAPRKMKAPPKGPPTSEAKDGDAKGDDGTAAAGGEKKKKKALPPPGNPPPPGAATSAVAAVRAKSSLPPPNGPPPNGAAPSASVAKIRGAARPPSGKPIGAPPSGAPPPTAAAARSEAKTSDDTTSGAERDAAKDVATPRMDGDRPSEAKKKTTRPPSASPPPSASLGNDVAAAESKPKKTAPPPSGKPTAKATPPSRAVDILSEDDAIASAPVSAAAVKKSPPKSKLSTSASQQSSLMMGAATPSAMASYTTPALMSSKPASTTTPTQAPKKSTMEVLNDTSASLHRGGRSDDADRPSTPGATSFGGRAVPFSGTLRPNVPEDEMIILVKKQEYKPEGDVAATTTKDAKRVLDLEDSLDDVEEIPFLDDAKPEPKTGSKTGEQRRIALQSHDDDDPEIVIETKSTAPAKSKANGNNGNSNGSGGGGGVGEAKSKPPSHEHKDADAMLDKPAAKETEKEDVYNELRKMKRNSLTRDDTRAAANHDHDHERDREPTDSASSSPRDAESKPRDSTEGREDDYKETSSGGAGGDDDGSPRSHGGSREKRERRREKRRNKQEEEPKKIQAQFFNPKSVPFLPDHLLDFVKRPLECGRGHIIKCFIERNDQNKLAPVFTLLLEVNSVSGRPIMYAKKRGTSRITSHYVISLNKEDLNLPRMMRSHQYIGKLRSSTSMMEYCLYDQGDNPEDLDSDCEVDDELRKSIRAELAVMRFHNSKKAYPRKMEIVIPAIVENGTSYLDWRPISRDQMMEEHMRAIATAGGQNVLDTQNFTFLHKRETKYDPLSSCIVDFRSRATCTSVKNFQLVHSEPVNEEMKERYRKLHPDYVYEDQGTVSLPQEHVILQLGKVGKHCFNMDFQYPLSMLQAFAICLARFDSKQR